MPKPRDDDEVGPRPSVLLGKHQSEQAQIAHRRDRLRGENTVSVPPSSVRGDLTIGEVAHHVAKRLLLIRE